MTLLYQPTTATGSAELAWEDSHNTPQRIAVVPTETKGWGTPPPPQTPKRRRCRRPSSSCWQKLRWLLQVKSRIRSGQSKHAHTLASYHPSWACREAESPFSPFLQREGAGEDRRALLRRVLVKTSPQPPAPHAWEV